MKKNKQVPRYPNAISVSWQPTDQGQILACSWFCSTQITENKIIAQPNSSVSFLMRQAFLTVRGLIPGALTLNIQTSVDWESANVSVFSH